MRIKNINLFLLKVELWSELNMHLTDISSTLKQQCESFLQNY